MKEESTRMPSNLLRTGIDSGRSFTSLFMEDARMSSKHLHVQENGGVFYVKFLDLKIVSDQIVEELYAELRALVDTGRGRKFVLQLEDVQFIAKLLFDRIILLEKLVKKLNQTGFVRLCPLNPNITYAMTMLGICKHFEFCNEKETRRAKSILAPSVIAA